MAKIHRSDAPLPQAPSVQVKASYTVTDLPKVSPQEPASFYDQDNDEDYRRRETAKCKKKRGNLLYTLAMIVFAAICQVCCPARQEQRLCRLDLHRRHQSGFSGYVRAGQQRLLSAS